MFVNVGDDPDGDGDDTNNTPGDGLTGSQQVSISLQSYFTSIKGDYGTFLLNYGYRNSSYDGSNETSVEILTLQYFLHDYDGATHKAKVDALTADAMDYLRVAVYDSEGEFTEFTETILIDIV